MREAGGKGGRGSGQLLLPRRIKGVSAPHLGPRSRLRHSPAAGNLGESLAGRWRGRGSLTLHPPPLPPFPPHRGRAHSWQPEPALVGTPPHLCIQGPPCLFWPPVHSAVVVETPLGTQTRSPTSQETASPPPALRRQGLEGQETGSTRVLLRCPAPSRGPSQGESGQPRASGSISLSLHFHDDTSISSTWESPCQRVSKKGRGGHFKSLSWRARSLGLGFPGWPRR